MELKRTIHKIVTGVPDDDAVRELVLLCQKIALVHLRRKERSRRIFHDLIRLATEDIALDCIADLFQRDESGKFLQLRAYFESIDYDTLGEEEALSHVRRLVFSKANIGMFRIYNEADPTLGRILRNIKLAIQALQNFVEVDRFGEHCIAPQLCDTLEHLPLFERHELEQRLREHARGNENVPTLLARLSRLLREQEEYCRIVPFITTAYVIRSIYSTPESAPREQPDVHEKLVLSDIARTIHGVCDNVKREMSMQYVEKKRVELCVYIRYFSIVKQHVQGRLLNEDGDIESFFDRLKVLLPGLTREEYRHKHKAKLEYLANLSYRRTVDTLRSEF